MQTLLCGLAVSSSLHFLPAPERFLLRRPPWQDVCGLPLDGRVLVLINVPCFPLLLFLCSFFCCASVLFLRPADAFVADLQSAAIVGVSTEGLF